MIFLRQNLLPIAISFFILLSLIAIRPNGQETGDQAVKQIQVLDLIANQYQSIECRYLAEPIDTDKKFLPLSDSFYVHMIQNKCFYVFPFYFSYLIAPFYDFIGAEAEYLIPYFSGVLTIWLLWFWAKELKLSEQLRKMLTLNIGLGTGIFLYCFTLSEISLNFFLVNYGFYFIWRFNQNFKIKFLVFAGLFLGLTVYLRQESLLLSFILMVMLIFTKNVSIRRLSPFILIYMVLIIIWMYLNFQIFQHPFGLRAIQQHKELNEGSFLLNRFLMYIEVFFYNRDNVGLFLSSPILLLIPFRWHLIKSIDSKFLPFALTAIIYTFLIPLATITYQGVNWGTRFLLSMVPVLLLTAFLMYQDIVKNNPESKLRRALIPSIAWSILGAFFFFSVLVYSHRQMQLGNKLVETHSEQTVILLSKVLAGTTVSSHGKKRIMQATDKGELLEILHILKRNNVEVVSFLYPKKDYLEGIDFLTKDVLNQIEILESVSKQGLNIDRVKIK
jgi:hypothetical protein